MNEREDLQQSFDPRTWNGLLDGEAGARPPAERRYRKASDTARPPYFLAGATAVAILSLGAVAAFLAREDSPQGQVTMAPAQSAEAGEPGISDAAAARTPDQP